MSGYTEQMVLRNVLGNANDKVGWELGHGIQLTTSSRWAGESEKLGGLKAVPTLNGDPTVKECKSAVAVLEEM